MGDTLTIRVTITAALTALFLTASAHAASGGQAAALTRFCAGAQPMSMGGAVVSLAHDPATILYNPSGAAYTQTGSITTSYSLLPMGRRNGLIGYGRQLDQYAGFSVAWTHSTVNGVTSYDSDGNAVGELDNSENLIAVSFARKINWFALGVSAKWYRLLLNEQSITGWAFDLGATAAPTPEFRVGFAVRDLIGTFDWNEGQTSTSYDNKDEVPVSISLGASYLAVPLRTTFAANYEHVANEGQYVHFGASVFVVDQLVLRAGYRWLPIGSASHDGGMTAGVSFSTGVGPSRLYIDYSILDDLFGMVHSIGLRYSI